MTDIRPRTSGCATAKRALRNKDANRTRKAKLWNIFDEEVKGDVRKLKILEECEMSIKERETCDACGADVEVGEDKFLTCVNPKCGVVYTDCLDQGAEWRFYGADDNGGNDPTRCGMPINPLLEESSYGCKVICSGKSSKEMRKIQRYVGWQSMPYSEKSRNDEFEHIKAMAQIHGIPKIIVDTALIYHKKVSEQRTFRGVNRDGIISASVYIACRINNCPRTAKEIAAIFNLDSASATKGCKNAMAIINQLERLNEDKTEFHQSKPFDFIERYCTRLNIAKDLIKLCQFMALKIEREKLIPENSPNSLACGIVFLVCQTFNLNITKNEIFKVSEISEVTINKCYKKLEPLSSQLIPSALLQKYGLKKET